MSNKELKALLELCKKYGVKRIKMKDLELDLETADLGSSSQAIDKALGDLPSSIKTDQPSPEDIMFWSSSEV